MSFKFMMKKKKIIGAIVVVAICVVIYLTSGGKKDNPVSYLETEVKIGDVISSVTATGSIEPVTSVDVGTQVSGIVSKIYVDYNSTVKKGQVIAELDKVNLMAELSSQQANASSAKSALDYQTTNYNRYKQMYDKGLISANDFEQARLSYQQARESYTTALNNVARAKTNLGYATITSPIDGIILSKAVEEGQTVAASFNTPTLFTIAKDLTDMRVIADIDEADIGEVKEGLRVTFTVDAYPDDVFNGAVTQVRQQATTSSNVVTYACVISAPNKDLKLKPGLTANATIYTKEIKNVLVIPAKALKFTPNEKLLQEGETIEDIKAKEKVWVRNGKAFKAIAVKTGNTNGTMVEVVSGLKQGQKIISEFNIDTPEDEQNGSQRNPFMPKPRDKKKDKEKDK